ncbi:MAG: SMC family ATPase [Clostridia bacterium]|nr:SMC family ATPase [Clostridia bacterium]
MKPVYLEFCGVNSFSEKAAIDFRKLLKGGIFGIFGDTGSGKSTILDCIHLALYGKIERSSETECINHKSDGFYIIYEFELAVDGVRHTYRVERARNRKKKIEARLYERDSEGKLLALADGATEVKEKVREIVGISYEDFKMCIALPQGEFAGLVKAPPKERLELVSRLFDLGRYGERLKAVLRERCGKAKGDVELYTRLMEGAEDCSEEKLAEAQSALVALQTEAETEAKLFAEAEQAFAVLERKKREYEEYGQAVKTLSVLEAELPIWMKKREELGLLPSAKTVLERAKAVSEAQRGIAEQTLAYERAEKALLEAKKTLSQKQSAYAAAGYEEAIAALNISLGKLQAAAEDIAAAETAKEQLRAAQNDYRALQQTQSKENFDGLIAQADEELAALGEDESLAEFVKRHCSSDILREAYGRVRADLRALGEKYPEAEADILALCEKYTVEGAGEAFDFVGAKLAYEKAEKRRAELKKRRAELEKRRLEQEKIKGELELLLKKGLLYRETYEAAMKKTEAVAKLGSKQSVEGQIKVLEAQKAAAEKAVRDTEAEISRLTAAAEGAKAAKQVYETALSAAKQALANALLESGFMGVEQAQELVKELGEEQRAKERIENFFREHTRLSDKKAEVERKGANAFSLEEYARAEREKLAVSQKKQELLLAIGKAEQALAALKEQKEKFAETAKQLKAAQKRYEEWEKLLKLVAAGRGGKTLMEFVASEYLQEICESATVTLLKLTGGRYFLRYDTEFFVGDNLDGGNLRAVATLSGGETFLVSLSLALALSGAICQKSLRPAEFFFLDEGFGTLDEKLVDTVMNVLSKVSAEFSVGIISHVEELKLRIENKIEVTGATKTHGSTLRVVAF